jgi:uncharacterized protein (DUF2147 family)
MRINAIATQAAAIAVVLLSAGAARAESTPLGVWIDHTGRGAVEISDCGGNLCGHVAWVKDTKDTDGCGAQIIGNVKPVGGNTWDNGWIYDPDRDEKFDVEIKPVGDDKLRVTGYAGIKWLSETMTWKRAPADLQKCSKGSDEVNKATPAKKAPTTAAAVEKPAGPKQANAPEASKTKPAGKTAAKPADNDEDVTADLNEDDAGEDNGKKKRKKGAFVAKLAEELEGSVKRRPDGTCRMDVPYVDMVVTFPCKDKD